METTTPMNIEQIYQGYGLSSENELYRYVVESYFNGQLKQAKNIIAEIHSINTMKHNYIETFIENLSVWFDAENANIIKKFFNL